MLYPDWDGPFALTASESVNMMLKVLDNVSLEQSGEVLSHYVSYICYPSNSEAC